MFAALRRVILLSLLPAAFLVPYLWGTGGLKKTAAKISGWFKPAANDAPDFETDTLDAVPPGVPVAHRAPFRPRVANIENPADVFRFDISPEWITQQWPEVSTVSAELDLQGMRVVLVTGTQEHDLAGSLTYFFDRNQRVQRISFYGSTGSADRLAAMLIQRYHLKPQPSLAAHLCLSRWNGVITSALLVTRAAKIRADQPLSKLSVQLELNRPSHSYGMSHEFMSRIKASAETGKW